LDTFRLNTLKKQRAAYFQAGCAIVAIRESFDVVLVSIDDPDNSATSWIDVTYPDPRHGRLRSSVAAQADAKSVIRAMLAGPASLLRYSFGACPREINLANRWMIEQDAIWRAISLAGKISKDSPALVHSLWGEVTSLIQGDKVWPAVEAIAQTLLITGELAGCEIRDIERHALGSSTKRI
jgi:hypothetical protein